MNKSKSSQPRGLFARVVLLALTCGLSVTLMSIPAAHAAETQATKAPALPVKAKFEKVPSNEKPPFVLKLTNQSKQPLEVSVTILLSVMSHNRDKARVIPAQVIPAGETWTVDGLAALDKVTIAAKGFAPLELEVH